MSSGPDPAHRIAQAERSAAVARERIGDTLSALQRKLNPKRVARRAMRDAADRGSTAAITGVETARRNPGAAAGITALAGLFLARHRIAATFRRLRGKDKPRLPAPLPAHPIDPHGGEPAAS